ASAGQAGVPRWPAGGLAAGRAPSDLAERCRRAGDYRIWRARNDTHALEDGIEALRNYLQGGQFDQAAGVAQGCLEKLQELSQTLAVATLAAEVLDTLPLDHSGFPSIAVAEASAHGALGLTDRALERSQQLLARNQRLATAEPDRADLQRDLSVSYNRMGDLYRALGQGEPARQAYLNSLQIRERLATAEPDRADLQRDLSVSYNKMGDLYQALGQGEPARQMYLNSLQIRERLATAEPDRADLQIDLATSLVKTGLAADPPSPAQLQRALTLLETLERQGRLAPADQPKIPALRELLAGLSAET
ncbi:MAG: tetratricopeptide repeat protein, partial [Vulcanococcus sp.]